MDYSKVLQDFAQRTRENLNLINNQVKKNGSGFEVTQLINSFLGLLVILDELDLEMLKKVDLHSLELHLLPVIGDTSKITPLEFKKKLHLIRNAFAHRNLSFNNELGEINGIYIENRNRERKTIWKEELTVDDMRFLFDCFYEIIMRL
jgi:hypothetical protein